MKTAYLVAKTLGSYDGDFIANSFVRFEVEGQLGIVALDYDLRGFLDSLLKSISGLLKMFKQE